MNRSIPLPTHQELATLAASIQSPADPAGRVAEALAIWRAAGAALHEQERRHLQAAAFEERMNDRMGGREFFDGMTRDQLLAALMPTLKTAGDRLARWRQYLPHALRFDKLMASGGAVTPQALEAMPETTQEEIERALESERHGNFPKWRAESIAFGFLKWNDSQAAEKRVNRARKAGAAKHSQKKPLDAPIVPKNSRKQAAASAKQKPPSRK
jgi:hypothetical protein